MGICKCNGDSCIAKSSCYRFTSKPSEYMQSWFCNPPYLNRGDEKCDHFMLDYNFKPKKMTKAERDEVVARIKKTSRN